MLQSVPLSSSSLSAFDPPPFSCEQTNNGEGTAWVRLAGELDLATAPQVQDALTRARFRSRLVVLDLSGLTFVDGAGIRVVIDETAHAARSGRRLITLDAPHCVEKILALTGRTDQIDSLEMHELAAGRDA